VNHYNGVGNLFERCQCAVGVDGYRQHRNIYIARRKTSTDRINGTALPAS
jgi:hypothetical protein